MDRIDVEQLRQKLQIQRHEILHFLSALEEETRSLEADSTQDSADRCVANLSKESLFERRSQRRTLLRMVDAALERIADGSFGTCVGCARDIPVRRLRALPWTQLCIRCQEEMEKNASLSASARTFATSEVTLRRAE